MTTLLYLAPIALVIGLIASGRVPLIGAALAGLAATLPAAFVALERPRESRQFQGELLETRIVRLPLRWTVADVRAAAVIKEPVVEGELWEVAAKHQFSQYRQRITRAARHGSGAATGKDS